MLAERLAGEWGPDGEGEAKALARALHGTVPVIAGAELAAAVAYRWKCQFNENAGVPAFTSVLPEADHNEIVSWDAARELGASRTWRWRTLRRTRATCGGRN